MTSGARKGIVYYPILHRPPMRCCLLLFAVLMPVVALAQPGGAEQDGPLAEAVAAYEEGAFDEAAALLADVIARDRKNAEANHLLALVYLDGPLHDERLARRHAERAVEAEPENPRFLETRLRQLQHELSEERAFSIADSRRATLARHILTLDAGSAIANEERALAYFLEFDWRRSLADRRGGWDTAAERGMSGAANRALRRSHEHLDRALASEPERASAYRLLLRTYAAARDDAGLLETARRMKAARTDDPDADLFLGLALYRAVHIAEADEAFTRSLAGMPDLQRHAFESVALLLSPDEADSVATDSVAFVGTFWRGRDPRLLTPQNERKLEHIARLALADLLFADTRTGRRGWESVKGEVAVRYGLPRTEVTWLSNDIMARDFSRYNRWVYDDFTLLFEDAFRGGDYDFWSSAKGEDEVTRAHSLMNRMPERFDYAPPERVGFPFLATTFRGERGGVDVLVRYGVPVEAGGERLDLRSGAFLLDSNAEVVAERRRTVERGRPAEVHAYDDATLWTDDFELNAAPGAYELAVEFEQAATGKIGFRRKALVLPDYAAGFSASDLLLAYAIEEAEGEAAGGVVRNGFRIEPAPWGVFGTEQPVYLYVEGYNLTPADDEYNRYAIEVTLRPKDTATGLAKLAQGLFGRRERGVAVEFEGSARGRDLSEYVVLGASSQLPGPYVLTLRLRDLVTGEALVRSADLFLE